MRKMLIAATLAALVLPAAAQATTTTSTIPFQADVPSCNGDTMISLSGQLLVVFTVTANPAGGFVFSTHTQPQGVRGIDTETGTTYLGTGLTRDLTVFSPSGVFSFTFVDRFHLQATGGAQSLDFSETVHITVLADGTVTAFVVDISGPC